MLSFVVFGACGGDDEIALDVYFAEIEVMDDDFRERTLAIDFGDGTGTEEEQLRDGREVIGSITDVLRDFVDDLDTLTPPSRAADEHEDSVRAGRDLIQKYVDLSGRLSGADSIEEFDALLLEANAELGPAVERFQATCDSLVEVAAENEITVDFNCGDEGV